jgi:ribosomal protein S18 acetylase RimI-like enzyme
MTGKASTMNIRRANSSDATLLSELGAKTFFDTFAKDNTPQNIKRYLEQSFSPQIQFNELSLPTNTFLIAEDNGKAVGFVQLIMDSHEESVKGTNPLEIRRIYASQAFIGKGVGRELMKASLAEAAERGCNCVWMGVWEKNPRAIGFYKKWGFVEVGTHVFTLGDDPQTDLIMELML